MCTANCVYLVLCRIKKHLGSGQFGLVNMGEWCQSSEVVNVAVKTLRPQSSDEEKVKFLQEAAIMGQFLHPNVVRLYGVVTVGEPVSCVSRETNFPTSSTSPLLFLSTHTHSLSLCQPHISSNKVLFMNRYSSAVVQLAILSSHYFHPLYKVKCE